MIAQDTAPASFDVAFPLAMFNLEAVKRAAYVLMARASIAFDVTNIEIHCTVTPASVKELASLIERDFRREVVDQDLRISIEARTEPMRNAILGLTFSRTSLQA